MGAVEIVVAGVGLGAAILIGSFLYFWYKEVRNAQAWEDDGK